MPFNISLLYVLGRDLALADALSRIRCDSDEPPESELENVATHATAGLSTLVSDTTAKRMAKETSEDDELRRVTEALQDGHSVIGQLAPFEAQLSSVEGVLLRGYRVVIPKSLEKKCCSAYTGATWASENAKQWPEY